MKTSSVFVVLGFVLCLIAPLSPAAGNTISGELVVREGTNQFRIVDHPGYFQAPSGTPLEALDGKPVIVELSGNRQVLRITENPIHVKPITTEYEIVTGELVLVDTIRGTFAIAGAPQTYSAPRDVDVRRYAGQRVELFVGENDRVIQIRPAGRAAFDRPGGTTALGRCSYNGETYGDGMTLCQTGTQYRCENGSWRSLGHGCGVAADLSCVHDGMSYSDGAARCDNSVRFVCDNGRWQYVNRGCGHDVTAADSPAQSCVFGDATIAHGYSICREGVTFRCSDGAWLNLGTACR